MSRHPAEPDPEVEASPSREPALPRVRPEDPAASALQAALMSGLHWLKINGPAAREGDEAGIHHLRTTARRLRSTLKLCEDLTYLDWNAQLAGELKWLGEALAAARDLDVLRARLGAASAEIGVRSQLDPLFEDLDRRHSQGLLDLRATFQQPRYQALSARLADSLTTMPLTDLASEPCRDVLPRLVAAAWKRLKQPARALASDDPEEDFHEVRKRAKQARYAAEAVKDALDPGAASAAARFARRARKVQDVLGAHQDATVAQEVLRASAASRPDQGAFNFAAGRLLQREAQEAAAAREQFFRVWPALDRKKVLRWLHP